MPGHTWLWAINFWLFQVKSRQLSIYLYNIQREWIWGVRTIFLAEPKVESHRCSATFTSVTSSRKTCLCTNTEISVPVCFPYLKWLQTSAGGGWLSLTMTVPILLMKTAVKPTFGSVRLKVTGKVTRIHKLAHLTHHHLTKRCRFPLALMGSRACLTYAQKKQVCIHIY